MDTDLDELFYNGLVEEAKKIEYAYFKGARLPVDYADIVDGVEHFEIREDDVWVCSFPKAGTTWTQEMVWCVGNDIDFEGAKTPINVRCPFFECSKTTTPGCVLARDPNAKMLPITIEECAKLPSPRYIKTHLPFCLLPKQLRTGEKGAKMVYVARNPKDACVSFYHHYKLLEGYIGTFEDFWKLFLGSRIIYTPFWENVIGYWEQKDRGDILFIKYEDMKADLPAVIRKVSSFLGKTFDDQQIATLTEHLSFSSMKLNPAVNYENFVDFANNTKLYGDFKVEGSFIRSGTTGQWKTAMSEETIQIFDEWTEKELKDYPELKAEFL